MRNISPIVENSNMVGGSSSESSFGFESLVGGHTQSNYPNSSKNEFQFQENNDDILDGMWFHQTIDVFELCFNDKTIFMH